MDPYWTGRSAHYGASLCAHVLAHAAIQALPEQIALLRRNPGPLPGKPFLPSLLRNADDQTVVSVAAVLQAIGQHRLGETNFGRWGIIGSPRFLGRISLTNAIVEYRTEGAWGVSPHLVPHRLLHAVSGTLSQVLGIHGMNYGVGGGPGGIGEAVLTALTLLDTEEVPGLWLILSGHEPEPVLDERGEVRSPGNCLAIAVALAPSRNGFEGTRLQYFPGIGRSPAATLTLETLFDALLPATAPAHGDWDVNAWGTLQLRPGASTYPHRERPSHAPVELSWPETALGVSK